MRLLAVLFALLLLFGCIVFEQQTTSTPSTTAPTEEQPSPPGEEQPSQPSEEQPTEEIPSAPPSPSLTVVSPSDGDRLDEGPVTLVVSVSNFELVEPGGANKEGQGHLKIVVDDQEPMFTTSLITELELSEGEHTVKVELVNNDGTPLSPPVMRSVTFTVGGTTPAMPSETRSVEITPEGLQPSALTLRVGDQLTVTNNANMPSSLVARNNEGTLFNTGVLRPGESATVTVEWSGEFELASPLNPNVKGTLTVSE